MISAVRTDVDSVTEQHQVVQYQGQVTSDDPSDAVRLVGFVEYQQALQHFDAILKIADEDELRAMDRYVQAHPEYAFETNLSRVLEEVPGALSEPINPLGFRQHGLPWVVALARVEYAAMLAAFVDVEQAFRSVGPSHYEMPAYRELVLDGFRTHALALRTDPELPMVLKDESRSGRLLAYFRRVLLAQRFAVAVRQALGNEMTPSQAQELALWEAQIQTVKKELASNVNGRLVALSSFGEGTRPGQSSSTRTRIIAE